MVECGSSPTYHQGFSTTGPERPGLPGPRSLERPPFMTDDDQTDTALRRIAELQAEHRALDAMILGIVEGPGCDELQLRRLKKRKLQVKDAVAQLQRLLVPDEPA